MKIEFQSFSMALYMIELEVEMFIHDYGITHDGEDVSVVNTDKSILFVYLDKDSAERKFDELDIYEFFNETEVRYDVLQARLTLTKWYIYNNEPAEDCDTIKEKDLLEPALKELLKDKN